MKRTILGLLAVYFLGTGLYIFFAPNTFYENTPGLAAMGPFNFHFVRDIALTFLASGGALLFGVIRQNKAALVAGAAWPFMHALFHLQIWVHRGLPFDDIWMFDTAGVVIPGVLALILATSSKTSADL